MSLMIGPDGSSGDVSIEKVPEALANGYKKAIKMRAPNGNVSIVSFDLVAAHLAAGFAIVHQ